MNRRILLCKEDPQTQSTWRARKDKLGLHGTRMSTSFISRHHKKQSTSIEARGRCPSKRGKLSTHGNPTCLPPFTSNMQSSYIGDKPFTL